MLLSVFLNVADQDYIASRIMYRNALLENFYWSASQAIEKYLKCILLYNYENGKDGHDLSGLFDKVVELEDIQLPFGQFERQFIERFVSVGKPDMRYGQLPINAYGPVLSEVDRFVWSIRRFCQQFFIEVHGMDPVEASRVRLARVASDYYLQSPQKFSLVGGFLEKVLKRDRKDMLRKGLTWKNKFYFHSKRGADERCYVFKRSFLYDHPEALEVLSPVVTISKDQQTIVKNILERRNSGS